MYARIFSRSSDLAHASRQHCGQYDERNRRAPLLSHTITIMTCGCFLQNHWLIRLVMRDFGELDAKRQQNAETPKADHVFFSQ